MVARDALAQATLKLASARGTAKKPREYMNGSPARSVLRISTMKLSECGRFVVLESLHIDRRVLEALSSWATKRGLRVQDAIQLAICAFDGGGCERAPPLDRSE